MIKASDQVGLKPACSAYSFLIFQLKHVVCTQKNRLNETVLLSTKTHVTTDVIEVISYSNIYSYTLAGFPVHFEIVSTSALFLIFVPSNIYQCTENPINFGDT